MSKNQNRLERLERQTAEAPAADCEDYRVAGKPIAQVVQERIEQLQARLPRLADSDDRRSEVEHRIQSLTNRLATLLSRTNSEGGGDDDGG